MYQIAIAYKNKRVGVKVLAKMYGFDIQSTQQVTPTLMRKLLDCIRDGKPVTLSMVPEHASGLDLGGVFADDFADVIADDIAEVEPRKSTGKPSRGYDNFGAW